MTKDEIISYMQVNTYKPLSAEDLLSKLEIDDVKRFLENLKELEHEGRIVLTRKQRYGITERMGLFVGRIDFHPRGFGFLIPDRSPGYYQGGDVFIAGKDLSGAMHNDKVIARLFSHKTIKGKPEGEVIRILKRHNQELVGTLEKSKDFGFVVPDDIRIGQDVFIAGGDLANANSGDKVVVKITRWPEARRNPEGRIIEVLGRENDPGVDILSIVRKHGFSEGFPLSALKEAKRVAACPIEDDMEQRVDLRDLPLITIDGADAKDLDDAISLEKLASGSYRLGVHIADVGYYVKEGSKLDQEALERGTSVYLVDRVIPMLPRELSNGICSLNPGVDRKAVSVLINFTPKGIVQEYEIKLSIVNIKQRMTYDEVNKLFAGDNELARKYQDFKGMLFSMKDLAKALKEKRKKEGCIDFDLPECKVLLDALGKPIEIIKLKRGSAEGIIEEFMLAANRTVAEHAYWLEVPFIYRVHKDPDEEDLYNLNEFLQAFDYRLNLQQRVVPMHFQSILEQVKGKPEERSVNTIMLRSMQHAAYLEQPTGHFGLATTYYAHFTSPIRRYPDLMIHRIIKETLTGTIPAKRKQKLAKLVAEAAEQSSIMERIAEEAERESVDLKRVEFMQQFVGEEYEGIISGITNFGFFVELENTVEGLVHVSSLSDDYYQFDEKHYTLIGEHTKRSFKIGQPVRVLLAKANMDARTIDFELIKG